MSKVLIVVDMQNDFVTGVLGTPEARGIVPNVLEKVQQCLKNEDIVIFTRDTHDRFYKETQEGKHLPIPHCVYGTNGWDIIPELDELAHEDGVIVDKTTFGHDYWEDVFDIRTNNISFPIESIELIGVCTDICVVSNALILKTIYPETPIIVDASCCAGSTPEKHVAALQVMKSCQIEVIE